jgi:hypothetical protein
MKEIPLVKSHNGRSSKELELLELQHINKISNILVDKLRKVGENFVLEKSS